MDIVLVNAVFFGESDSPHIGQFILRDILRKKYSVECINFDYLNKTNIIRYSEDFNETIKILGDYIINKNPKVVGFYTICNSFLVTIKIAEYIKNKVSNIKIILGGPHATVTKDECLTAFRFIDVISLGEAEYTIEALVDALINNTDLINVLGIAFNKNGQIVETKSPQLIKDNELGKYMVYDYSPFNILSTERFNLEGGRGCPFGCTFCTTCSFWGRKFRVKDVDVLLYEMDKINRLYGVNKFSIQHDMFTAKREHIIEFCNKLINLNKNYDWTCSSRVDVLDKEMIDIMKKSNCSAIYLGIEFGSSQMQRKINKNLILEDALTTIKYIKRVGINITASFIYCHPEETIDDFKQTIKFLEEIICLGISEVQLHRFIPLPSTIDTKKILNRMYFDQSVIEATLNNVTLSNNEVQELILKYPNMFSQYYTFDSEVKNKYKRFDYFIEIINTMWEFYSNCFKYMIKKYGLESLYFMYEDNLDKLYIQAQNDKIEERTNTDYSFKLNRVNDAIIDVFELEKKKNDKIFNVIFDYDTYKFSYFINRDKIAKIRKFDINLYKAINDNKIVDEEYYVKYWFKGEAVITTHVIPKKQKHMIINNKDIQNEIETTIN